MKASDIINFSSKPIVRPGKSGISGYGLFAKKHISKGRPVVVYYGDKMSDEEVYDLYMENREEYREVSKNMRGTPNGFTIRGDKTNENNNLLGVYVNDAGSITCKKGYLTQKALFDYAKTLSDCNLKVVETEDYPVYQSDKRIKKGEELLAHYGIGYWLSQVGCTPEEISDLNRMYNFDSFY